MGEHPVVRTALIRMAEGKETKLDVVFIHREPLIERVELAVKIGVRQDGALGIACRPRRVDQRANVIGFCLAEPFLKLLIFFRFFSLFEKITEIQYFWAFVDFRGAVENDNLLDVF